MSTGLFQDEEESYNIEETKFVLKGSAPSTDSSMEDEPMDFGGDDFSSEDGGDLGGEEEPVDDKPFDDEPFDAGVEADEDTDPEKYIQQLSGKLGQSLRQHSEDAGQPDFDLEKFAVNSVLSATHTSEMDAEDQKDIINKVKNAGKGDDTGMEGDVEGDVEGDIEVDEPAGDEDLDFGEEGLGEGDDAMWNNERGQSADSRFGKDDQWESYLHESKKSGIFVKKDELIKKLRLMENTEPMVEPKPAIKPVVTPAKPLRETDRPFSPKRRTHVQPDPKAESNNEMINDEEVEK